MYLVWCVHYILHSYNKGSYRKENVIKKIIRKGKYIYTMFSILCIIGPTQFQCVIQGSTEVETIFTLQQTNSPIFPDFQSQKVTSLLFSVEKIKSSGRKDFYLPASGVHTDRHEYTFTHSLILSFKCLRNGYSTPGTVLKTSCE